LDENQLISSVLSGNKEAFRFLYRLHKGAAWSLAMHICKNDELAKDAVQIAFASAYKYLYAFRRDSSFKTWLLRIVKNESVKICKYEQRYAEMDEAATVQEYSGAAAYLNLESKDKSNWITQILGKLNERESLVLKLFYLQELSIGEVGDVMQYKEGNVKVILHRARKHFKEIVGNSVI